MDQHPIQRGVEILLVALCYRNRDKLRPGGPLDSYANFTFTFTLSATDKLRLAFQYISVVLQRFWYAKVFLGAWNLNGKSFLLVVCLFFHEFYTCNRQLNVYQYHPTGGLMQILHFNWLRYQRTISNSPRIAKLAQSSFTPSFVSFPNKNFFNLHLLTLLLPFLSDQLATGQQPIRLRLMGY